MTYCLGILAKDGLVMASDSPERWIRPGERMQENALL
jgi:predicted proteasome-type protease